MEKETNSLFNSVLRSYFIPFRNKYLNISLYIGIGVLSSVAVVNNLNSYNRDLKKFETGEINKKTEIHDYTTVGKLEKYLFNNDKGCLFLKLVGLEN